jgi:hypothetical protein
MRRLNLLLLCAVFLAACSQPAASPPPTATAAPIVTPPPTWTPTPFVSSIATPAPTRALSPVATPAASMVYTTTDQLFTLKVPSNWKISSGQQQAVGSQTQAMNYIAIGAPGKAPQPAILIFYGWPAAGAIDNDNAWEQAFALASLTIKVCPMQLTTGDAINIGGESGKFIGYKDSCQVQGELIGFVHQSVNFGVLLEAPEQIWPDWRSTLRSIIGSLQFEQ